ncbi:response regulator [Aliihoeflea sp. 40Bstr573]|uniref:response regulator n=1 Tax=Aliihoeflea sp. 40Bstr573 TaxID=2696467 RepID=UPI0020964B5C|nr:response regulator [Aliihoeflea sp. 40Bstr573]MCO6386281.1 response regulator [Aliihoeflea sp. 40Bstr573]
MQGTDGKEHSPRRTEFASAVMGQGLDSALVQIVSSAHINALVVSKIVERCGLKAFATGIDEAMSHYHQRLPGTVILDGGATNRDCDGILDTLLTSAGSRRGRPGILFVANRMLSDDEEAEFGPPDAVVAKPITPESLQPAIRHLVARLAPPAPRA